MSPMGQGQRWDHPQAAAAIHSIAEVVECGGRRSFVPDIKKPADFTSVIGVFTDLSCSWRGPPLPRRLMLHRPPLALLTRDVVDATHNLPGRGVMNHVPAILDQEQL